MNSSDLDAPGSISAWDRFPGNPGFCPAARRLVRSALHGFGPVMHDAALVVSELFANACAHTRSGEEGGALMVEVSGTFNGSAVVTVTDDGPRWSDLARGVRPLPRTGDAGPESMGSRGLRLVAACSADWGYRFLERDRLAVWAMLPVAGRSALQPVAAEEQMSF